MQTLKIYQSLWAMELRRPDGFEHSDEERFEKTAAAGFVGVCLDATAVSIIGTVYPLTVEDAELIFLCELRLICFRYWLVISPRLLLI